MLERILRRGSSSAPPTRLDVQRSLGVGFSLGAGLLAFLSLVARSLAFWHLSRIPRGLLLGCGGLALGLLIALALRAAWLHLTTLRGRMLVWLAVVILLGAALKMILPAPAIPLLHVLDLEVLPGSGPIQLIELHGANGQTLLPGDYQAEGDWQHTPEGLFAQGSAPARVHYTFYASPQGQLQLLFGIQPQAGVVRVRLNGQEQEIRLAGIANSQRLVDLPFQKQSPWTRPLLLADFALADFVLPLFLFVLPLPLARGAGWAWAKSRAVLQSRRVVLDRSLVFIVAFLGVCLLPLQGFQGNWESFPTQFWSYKPLWQAFSVVRQRILGDVLFDKVLVGSNDWLVLVGDNGADDYQNSHLFSQEQLFQIQHRIDGIANALKSQGITFLMVVAPNKNTIYPENIPGQLPVLGAQSRLDQVLDYQKQHGVTSILDLRPALLAARNDRPLFYRTDTHWNGYGAFLGYAEIVKALHSDYPNLSAHPLKDYRLADESVHQGDLGLRFAPGSAPETFFELAPRFDSPVTRFELLQDKVLYSFRYRQNAPADAPSAIIYHDSFMSAMAPFLADHFSKSTFIWSLQMNLAYIQSEHPNVVIFECTERYLDSLLDLPMSQ